MKCTFSPKPGGFRASGFRVEGYKLHTTYIFEDAFSELILRNPKHSRFPIKEPTKTVGCHIKEPKNTVRFHRV